MISISIQFFFYDSRKQSLILFYCCVTVRSTLQYIIVHLLYILVNYLFRFTRLPYREDVIEAGVSVTFKRKFRINFLVNVFF